jgi:hypothetical protein
MACACWFILVVALLLDPAAVLLLLAATIGGAPMSNSNRTNVDRLVANIVLDCSIQRCFAPHGRYDDCVIAIELSRGDPRSTADELEVLAFLQQHIAGGADG